MEMETAAASETNRQLEAIFIATPPCTPLVASLTRTTTPRDLPTMYHFDFATMESDAADDDQNEELPGPPPPPISGMSIPVPEYGGDSTELSPCPNCSRKFNPTALRKHAVVCEKMAAKKRKPFDSSRQRRDGTALSTYVLPKNFGLPNAEKAAGLHTPPGVSRESSTVVNSEAAASPLPTRRRADPDKARRGTLRKGAAAAPECPAAASPQAAPAAAAPQDYVREKAARAERSRVRRSVKEPATDKCPHCERSFNPKAFDRHVEWCKEKAIQNNMKSSSSNTAETKAKERMEARKQYRPPNLKTKRSLNRDKYSGSQEEQYEAEMVAQKQAQMMTSSMHSDNLQRIVPSQIKVPRPGTPQTKAAAIITQNTVNLCMASGEASTYIQERVACMNPWRKQRETCQQIDVTMDRLRRTATSESLQLAKLDCVDAAPLLPVKSRRALPRQKLETAEHLIAVPQAAITFEELNGLIQRKAGAKICNIKMELDEQELKVSPKLRSATSLVRQAHRRIRTRENPNIDLRSLEPPKSSFDLTSKGIVPAGDLSNCDPLPAPLKFRQKSKNTLYSGSEDEGSNSPCGEIQIKLETSTIRTICRPKKHGNLPIIMNSSEPMRALPMPEMKQSLEELSQTRLPRIDKADAPKDHYKENKDVNLEDGEMELDELDYDEADMEVDHLLSKAKLLEEPYDDEADDVMEELASDEEEEKPEEPQLKLPSLQPSNVSRRLVLLEQDEEGTMYIKAPPSPNKRQTPRPARPPSTETTLTNSGIISDKYDPFLSAKRQLEELCSPNTPPDNEPCTTMSTSLTSTLGKPHTTTTTTTTPTTTTSKLTPMSNFRRTSSLRGPRRTPLLPSRPLFATNYRPTIQRGLSDEGPISNNFLKPEEYDEMPVRAACVNDFHSPRVVRRDTSASNRKQQLKLPLGGATEPTDGASKPTTRNVAKTDSLAVFLKYEHELEQLNAKAAEVAANSKELNTKELKDKSNNLSKQNSAKNLTLSPNSGQLPPLTTPISPPGSATTAPKENNENQAHNFATPLRLEPINKPMTPLTPNNSNNNSGAPIKLESIFGVNRLGGGGDYIDPKLINPCDNLHVQQSSTGSSSNASSTPQQISQSRSSSQSTITTNQEQRRHSGDSRNLLKRKMRLGRNQFLYDASPEEEAYISSSGSCADDEANRSSLESDEQCWQQQQKQLLSKNLLNPLSPMPQLPTFDDFDFEEFLSSFENENDEEQFPLFRDCREFLLNRTTSRHRASFQKATSTLTSTPLQPQPQTPTATQKTSQLIMSPKYTPTTKETHAHRSDSNISSGSYRTPATSSGSYKTPMTSGDEKMQRQQSNMGSSQKSQKSIDKSEIFISIDTEPNAQGRSPISPASLRHMVGNAQTPIDVLHIENGNEPEHAKFSKISDSEDHFDAGLDDEISRVHYKKRLNSTASAAAKLPLPNVEANNAKNAIEKMRSDFQQLGEEVGASMRRDMMQRKEQVQQQQQQKKAQQELNVNAPLTPSPSGDSDELSSLDGYPMSSSQSSRRGASSKLSSDSAYGSTNSPYSLSRQRSGEQEHSNITQRSQHQMRPHTASGALASAGKLSSAMMDASTQAASNYGTLKARQRMFAGSFSGGGGGGDGDGPGDCCPAYSSSSSEHSMPQQQQQQQNSNYNYQQQQSQMQAAYNNNNNNSYEHMKNMNNHNNNNTMTPTTSQHSLVSNTSNGSSNMSATVRRLLTDK
ncbi:hypothetical protein ACLKA7_013552 [Drosophila subpalustris]